MALRQRGLTARYNCASRKRNAAPLLLEALSDRVLLSAGLTLNVPPILSAVGGPSAAIAPANQEVVPPIGNTATNSAKTVVAAASNTPGDPVNDANQAVTLIAMDPTVGTDSSTNGPDPTTNGVDSTTNTTDSTTNTTSGDGAADSTNNLDSTATDTSADLTNNINQIDGSLGTDTTNALDSTNNTSGDSSNNTDQTILPIGTDPTSNADSTSLSTLGTTVLNSSLGVIDTSQTITITPVGATSTITPITIRPVATAGSMSVTNAGSTTASGDGTDTITPGTFTTSASFEPHTLVSLSKTIHTAAFARSESAASSKGNIDPSALAPEIASSTAAPASALASAYDTTSSGFIAPPAAPAPAPTSSGGDDQASEAAGPGREVVVCEQGATPMTPLAEPPSDAGIGLAPLDGSGQAVVPTLGARAAEPMDLLKENDGLAFAGRFIVGLDIVPAPLPGDTSIEALTAVGNSAPADATIFTHPDGSGRAAVDQSVWQRFDGWMMLLAGGLLSAGMWQWNRTTDPRRMALGK